MRFQRASDQFEKTARIRAVRRDIARVKTEINSRLRANNADDNANTNKEN